MTGDCHVRFCKGLGVKLPWSTNPVPLYSTAAVAAARKTALLVIALAGVTVLRLEAAELQHGAATTT
jgi:hypothetical protein